MKHFFFLVGATKQIKIQLKQSQRRKEQGQDGKD
jgi:hypothetical protein